MQKRTNSPQSPSPKIEGALTEFDRRLDQRKAEKESIARQILDAGLIQAGDKVFIALGTTCFYIAEALMRHFGELHIVTHSVAVVRRYRELWSSGAITSSGVKVEITGGVVDPTMAYVKGARLGPLNGAKLIVSPHAINQTCIGGYDAAPELQRLVRQHGEIIVAATFEKFGRAFQNSIRNWGQCKSHGQKQWTLVFPDVPPATADGVVDWTVVEAAVDRIQRESLAWLPGKLPRIS